MQIPETRYARTDDGIHLAYQVHGDGPFDLLWLHGWTGGLEVLWEHPTMSSWYEELGRVARVIRFDMRATGLSDRATELPTLETQVRDMRTVLDEVGSYSTVVGGAGPSSAPAALFAATDPGRTRALVLWTPWVKGIGPWGTDTEEAERDIQMALESWGTERYAAFIMADTAPSMTTDRTFIVWYAKVLRHWVTPGAAAELIGRFYETDVEDVMRSIQVPTLVLAREWEDPEIDEQVAALVPGARFIRLPGGDVAAFVGDRRSVAEAMASFVYDLNRSTAPRPDDRTLATVLFTDIVDSTARGAAMGDRAWRDLREQHDEVVRASLQRFHGREIKTMGDGFLATFDGPERGVRCAYAIVAGVKALGIEIRAGLHTGEVTLEGDDITGVGVAIGARVGAKAGASEILVSRTVKDLVAGSGLVFEDAGEHELKGVPDRWQLYRVID